MFDVDKKITKLGKIHDQIERMPGGKEKFLLMTNYVSYCSALYNLVPEGMFPYNIDEFTNDYSYKKHGKYFRQEVNDIQDSLPVIKELFIRADDINRECGLEKEIIFKDNINASLGFELIDSFFRNMPDNIRKVYEEVCEENLFFTAEGESLAYNTDYSGCATVKCQADFKRYYTYMALAHELGHCYQFRLNTQGNNFNFLRPDTEVVSIFMEMIFNHFVDEFVYGKEYGISCLLRRQSLFAKWLSFQRMLVENIEWSKVNGDKSIVGIVNYKDMSDKDRELLKSNNVNLSDEEKNMGYFVVNMNVINYRYTISNLIASYLVDVYLNDKGEGLRLLKDYLMLPPGVSLEEKLKMYDITGDSYKKLIKRVSSYGKSKCLL